MPGPPLSVRLDVVTVVAGAGVRALDAIPAGVEVLRLDGTIVPWHAVPPEEIAYVVLADNGDWVIPEAPQRYVNHSCRPNLRCDESRALVTTRAVAAGEELTMSYHVLEPFEIERRRRHPDWYFWDARWSFDCRCGEPGCRGRIDGYALPEPDAG